MKTLHVTVIPPSLLVLLLTIVGCQTEHVVKTESVVEIKPITIEPIYATININVMIDKELDSFFDYEESLKPVKS